MADALPWLHCREERELTLEFSTAKNRACMKDFARVKTTTNELEFVEWKATILGRRAERIASHNISPAGHIRPLALYLGGGPQDTEKLSEKGKKKLCRHDTACQHTGLKSSTSRGAFVSRQVLFAL